MPRPQFGCHETKADILKAIANRPSTVRSWFGDPGDVQVRFHEGVAAVRYRITEFTEVNGHVQTLEQRRTKIVSVSCGPMDSHCRCGESHCLRS
jgi:hypothetical protein